MTAFLIFYAALAVLTGASVLLLSSGEKKHPVFRTILLIIYILAIIGILFATGVLEAKFGMTRLWSSVIAVCAVLIIYGSDAAGSKIAKNREEKENGKDESSQNDN